VCQNGKRLNGGPLAAGDSIHVLVRRRLLRHRSR